MAHFPLGNLLHPFELNQMVTDSSCLISPSAAVNWVCSAFRIERALDYPGFTVNPRDYDSSTSDPTMVNS